MDNRYESLKLENQLCFPLYAALRVVFKQYRPYLDALNLTYTQYIAMMVFCDVKCINVKELRRKLVLDSGTLKPVLKRLEAKGFVHRFRSHRDKRVLLVEITSEDEALRKQAASVPASVAGCICLNPDEAMQLHGLPYKLLRALNEQ